ncbi:MAG: helix-turn-helix domain-containing protein [Egibacteraceae bacterium]
MQPANRITPQHTPAQPDDSPYGRLEAELAGLSFGKRIAFLRRRLELKQIVTAELAGRSGSWLSKVERGVLRYEDLGVIADLAAVLGVPPTLLIDMDLRSILTGEGGQRPAPPHVPTPGVGRAAGIRDTLAALATRLDSLERCLESQHVNGIVDDDDAVTVWVNATIGEVPAMIPVRLSRRQVLAAGGAALLALPAGLLDPDERGRIAAAVDAPGRADMAMVAHLETLLAHYRRLDDSIGGHRLLAPVRASLALVDHLRETARPPVRQALLSVSAQYLELTGWLCVDSEGHTAGQRAYGDALDRATEAGEHALARYVLMSQSEQAFHQRDAPSAVTLAQAAQAGEGRLTPAVAAWAADLAARAWALDGKPDACKRELDEATGLLAASAEAGRAGEPPWIYHFGEESLAGHQGVCLIELGDYRAGIEALDAALAALPDDWARDRASLLCRSATAHAGNNDPEQAGAVACEAARLAIPLGHTRSLTKLASLHAELTAAGKDPPAVRDLGDLLRL